MAFHRARYLKKVKQEPRVIMFNSVLARYVAANNEHAHDIPVTTMHRWVSEWFKAMGLKRAPQFADYKHDWHAVASAVLHAAAHGKKGAANWGHLIVDEGQDFPKEMYASLALLLSEVGSEKQAPAALTVFADENQRLWPENSTISDIRRALQLTDDGRTFALSRNYRNSRQIAAFASHFHCGLETGVADPPRRNGPLPVVSLHPHQPAMIAAIEEFLEQIRGLKVDVGIVCPKDRTRNYVFNQLSEKYAHDGEFVIQTFKSRDAVHRADRLTFDKDGIVTVLNKESVKGLEFDAVLVIDPFLRADAEGSGEQQFKMGMYVCCSRAREHLRLLFVSEKTKVMKALPKPSSKLYELVED